MTKFIQTFPSSFEDKDTTDYEALSNHPKIEDKELVGNKTLEDFGAQGKVLSMPVAGESTVYTALARLKELTDDLDAKADDISEESEETYQPKVLTSPIAGASSVVTALSAINTKASEIASDLANYYLKTETYSQDEVDALIAAIVTIDIKAVDALPTTDISKTTIYLVPKSTAQTNNAKDEYINTTGTSAGWEKIGDTEIDLSGYVTTDALTTALSSYYTKTALDALLLDKVDKVTGKGLSTNDFTTVLKTKLEDIDTDIYQTKTISFKVAGASSVVTALQALENRNNQNVTFTKDTDTGEIQKIEEVTDKYKKTVTFSKSATSTVITETTQYTGDTTKYICTSTITDSGVEVKYTTG